MRSSKSWKGEILLSESIKRICTLTGRSVKEIIRDPISIVFLIGLPLAMEILFYLIFHSMTDQFEMKYLAPGIVVFSQAFISLFSGLLISLDRAGSFLVRLFVSKAKPYEFIFGYALALFPIAIVQSILFFVVGGIIDSSLWSVGMIYGILISMVTAIFFGGAGILLGSVCNEKSVGGVASVIIAGQSMLSGMWFPTQGMSKSFLTFMRVLPFKNATMLVQNALNGVNDVFDDFLLPLIIVLAYTAAIFIAAIVCFGKKMKNL